MRMRKFPVNGTEILVIDRVEHLDPDRTKAQINALEDVGIIAIITREPVDFEGEGWMTPHEFVSDAERTDALDQIGGVIEHLVAARCPQGVLDDGPARGVEWLADVYEATRMALQQEQTKKASRPWTDGVVQAWRELSEEEREAIRSISWPMYRNLQAATLAAINVEPETSPQDGTPPTEEMSEILEDIQADYDRRTDHE